MIAKKSLENGEDCDNIPESLRQLLAMQAMETGRPLPRQLFGRPGLPIAQYGSGGMLMAGDPNATGKVGMYSRANKPETSLIPSSHPSLHVPIP